MQYSRNVFSVMFVGACENATMKITLTIEQLSHSTTVLFFNLGESMLTLMPGQPSRTTVKSHCQLVQSLLSWKYRHAQLEQRSIHSGRSQIAAL